jgi:hypothetical protein
MLATASARRRIAAAQKARWAKLEAGQTGVDTGELAASYAAVFRHNAPAANYEFELAACWESRYVGVVQRV